MPKSPPYSPEFRREAVQLLRSSGRSIPLLAKELGVSPQTLRNWVSQRDVDVLERAIDCMGGDRIDDVRPAWPA